MSAREGMFPIIGVFGEDDAEIILKNAAEKTVCLAKRHCPELLKPAKNSNDLVSITIRISQPDKDILDFIAEKATTGSRHNSAAAVIEKFIVFQFIRKIRTIAEEEKQKENDEK